LNRAILKRDLAEKSGTNSLALFSTTRRKFLGLAAAAGATALGVDSVLIDPNFPEIVRKEIVLKRWPSRLDGFTIALLSDFHYDAYFSVHPARAAIEMVNGLHPDLIALTGDFISVPWVGAAASQAHYAEPCAALLKNLHAPYGLWAVLGNHDVGSDAERITAALKNVGIPVLGNKSVAIEKDSARFWLSGVDDALDGAPSLDASLRGVPSDEATVLLAHEPDYADYASRYPIDLQLSGHSHGGQVKLPFLRPLYLPELAKKYIAGLYQIAGLTLYANRGIGTVGIPVRFNCPPEITLLTLCRASSS
jgi:uncharacterized protein